MGWVCEVVGSARKRAELGGDECLAGWWYGVEKPLVKGPSAGAGGGAGAWVWPEAMAAHVGGSHPVAAKVRAASAAAWSAGDA